MFTSWSKVLLAKSYMYLQMGEECNPERTGEAGGKERERERAPDDATEKVGATTHRCGALGGIWAMCVHTHTPGLQLSLGSDGGVTVFARVLAAAFVNADVTIIVSSGLFHLYPSPGARLAPIVKADGKYSAPVLASQPADHRRRPWFSRADPQTAARRGSAWVAGPR